MDSLRRGGELLLRHRLPVLLLIAMATGVLGYHATHLRLGVDFGALVPGAHPAVQVNHTYAGRFGRALAVTVMLEAKAGSIFTVEALNRLWHMTAALEQVPGLDAARIESIAHRSVRQLKVGAGGTLRAQPVMAGPIARPEEADAIRRTVLATDYLRGRLVSPDGTAALIRADVTDAQADYGHLVQQINEHLVAPFSDATTHVFVAGEPILYGWAHLYARRALFIFALTPLLLWVFLTLHFRDWRGALRATLSGALAAIWGLGVLHLVGLRLDPFTLVIPVFLTARAVSHAVHMQARFAAAYARAGDTHTAIVDTLSGLFAPTLTGILIDALGIAVLVLVPIVLVQKLALAAACWIAAIAVGELLLAPIVFSYLPPSRRRPGAATWVQRILARYGDALLSRAGRRVTAAAVVMVVAACAYGWRVPAVGEIPDARLLGAQAPYTVAHRAIAQQFGGVERLVVVAEGYDTDAMKAPETLRAMEGLQRHLERDPAIGTSLSLADLVRPLNAVFHEYEPKWGIIPHEAADVAGLFSIFFAATPPETMRAVDPSYTAAPVTFSLRDHSAATIRRIVREAQHYIAASYIEALGITVADAPGGSLTVASVRDTPTWEPGGAAWVAGRSASREGPFRPGDRIVAVADRRVDSVAGFEAALMQQAERSAALELTLQRDGELLDITLRAPWKAVFRLAGGFAGVLAAANDAVARADLLLLGLGLTAVYAALVLTCRSFVAGLYVLVPVILGHIVVQASLRTQHLGPSLHTLPIVAVGVGFGVDYGLYLVSRITEELKMGCELAAAVRQALRTSGGAVLVTAGSMAAAMLLWRLSAVRFDAQMGLVLALWIATSGVAALSVLPAAIVAFQPRFITAGE